MRRTRGFHVSFTFEPYKISELCISEASLAPICSSSFYIYHPNCGNESYLLFYLLILLVHTLNVEIRSYPKYIQIGIYNPILFHCTMPSLRFSLYHRFIMTAHFLVNQKQDKTVGIRLETLSSYPVSRRLIPDDLYAENLH